MVDSVLKIHKSFSIKIGIYQNISVQNRPISANFQPVTFWSLDWVPAKLVCMNHLKAPTLCTNFSCARQMVFEL